MIFNALKNTLNNIIMTLETSLVHLFFEVKKDIALTFISWMSIDCSSSSLNTLSRMVRAISLQLQQA